MQKLWMAYLLAALLCLSTGLFAQLNNTPFGRNLYGLADSTAKLSLGIQNINSLKNNEYFNDVVDGRTFFGAQLLPMLVYSPAAKVRFIGGVLAQKDFGNEVFARTEPIYGLRIAQNNWQLLFGTLDGQLEHRLIEPLYNFERLLTAPLENGIQIKYASNRLWVDVWTDWQHMIYPGDSAQEQIWGGASLVGQLLDKPRLKIALPVQLTVFHAGGQIDVSGAPLVLLANTVLGLQMELKPKTDGKYKGLQLAVYQAGYMDRAPGSKVHPFSGGWGQLFCLTALFAKQRLSVEYWQGNQFYAPLGGPLYSSVSSKVVKQQDYHLKRKLLFVRHSVNIRVIDNMFLTLRTEPLWDFNGNKLEFSNSLHISYRQTVGLHKSRG